MRKLIWHLNRTESRKEKKPIHSLIGRENKQRGLRACLKNKMYRGFWWHLKQFKIGRTFFPASRNKHKAIKAMQQLRKELQCTSVIF